MFKENAHVCVCMCVFVCYGDVWHTLEEVDDVWYIIGGEWRPLEAADEYGLSRPIYIKGAVCSLEKIFFFFMREQTQFVFMTE